MSTCSYVRDSTRVCTLDCLFFWNNVLFSPEHTCCHSNRAVFWHQGVECGYTKKDVWWLTPFLWRTCIRKGVIPASLFHPPLLSLPSNSLIPVWAVCRSRWAALLSPLSSLLSPVFARSASVALSPLCLTVCAPLCSCSSASLLYLLQCFDSSRSALSSRWQTEVRLLDTHVHARTPTHTLKPLCDKTSSKVHQAVNVCGCAFLPSLTLGAKPAPWSTFNT